MAHIASPVNVTKEQLFLRVPVDGNLVFVDVSSYTGKKSPYTSKVRTSVGARISKEVLAYCLMQVPKKFMQSLFVENDLRLPRRNFYALEERSLELSNDQEMPLGADDLILDMQGETRRFKFKLEDGVFFLKPSSADEDDVFELPARPLTYSIYFRSPNIDRIVAIQYRGFLDRKPGEAENYTRLAAKALANLSGLANFQIVTGIVAVDMPHPPTAPAIRPARLKSDVVRFNVPVVMYDNEGASVQGSGSIAVEIDLDHANSTTGQLIFNLDPSDDIKPIFPVYEKLVRDAITAEVNKLIPADEMQRFTYDIVLGDLDTNAIAAMRSYLTSFPGLDVTPSQYRTRTVAQS